jgi:hypothetical protein
MVSMPLAGGAAPHAHQASSSTAGACRDRDPPARVPSAPIVWVGRPRSSMRPARRR